MSQWMQCNFIQTNPIWADSVCTFESGGKGDNAPEGKRVPFKPTGLLDRPKKKAGKVEGRVEEASEIQAEIAGRLAREFSEETLRLPSAEPSPVAQMSLSEIEQEIGLILRKKIRTEEDEILLLMLMVAGTA